MGVKVYGCMFHWLQRIVKRLKLYNLWQYYEKAHVTKKKFKSNALYCKEFRTIITQVMALCIVPEHLIEIIFFVLMEKLLLWTDKYHKKLPEDIQSNILQFQQYMLNTWISTKFYKKHNASYQLSDWNVSKSLIKTNNAAEQLNRWIQLVCGNYFTGKDMLKWFDAELRDADKIFHQVTQKKNYSFLNSRNKKLLFKYQILAAKTKQLTKIQYQPNIKLELHQKNRILKIMTNIGHVLNVYRKLKWSKHKVMCILRCFIYYALGCFDCKNVFFFLCICYSCHYQYFLQVYPEYENESYWDSFFESLSNAM